MLFAYSLLSAGVLLNIHYCHGEASSASLYVDAHGCICHDQEHPEDEKGCCDDDTILIKASDEQLPQSNIVLPILSDQVPEYTDFRPEFDERLTEAPTVLANPPPLINVSLVRQYQCPLLYS